PYANNCDDSEVVFNNGKWSSYTPQQLKRPKTTKLSCTKTVQNKKYISVNYLLMEEKLNFLKLQKEKFIEEHNKKMEIYKKKVQLLDLQINAFDKIKEADNDEVLLPTPAATPPPGISLNEDYGVAAAAAAFLDNDGHDQGRVGDGSPSSQGNFA
ncbi:unnamed protein product, partial [Acanthoscelides obtectus]